MESIFDIQNEYYKSLKQVPPPMLPHGNDPKAIRSKLRRRSIPKQLTNIPSCPSPPEPGSKPLPASDLPDGFQPELTFRALAAYSLLRTLGTELRLAPFTPNVFLRALHLPFPNRLVGKIHVALLRVLLSNLDMGYHWSDKTPPFDVTKKRRIDGIRWSLRAGDNLRLLDTYTWPIFYDDYCHLSADLIHASLHNTTDFAELRNMDVSGLESDSEKMLQEAMNNGSLNKKWGKQEVKMDILYLQASDNESSERSVEQAEEKDDDSNDFDDDDEDDDYVDKSSKYRSKKKLKTKPTNDRKYTARQQQILSQQSLGHQSSGYKSSPYAWVNEGQQDNFALRNQSLQQEPWLYSQYTQSQQTDEQVGTLWGAVNPNSLIKNGKGRLLSVEPVVLRRGTADQTFLENVLGETQQYDLESVSSGIGLVRDPSKEILFGLIPDSVETFPTRPKLKLSSKHSSKSFAGPSDKDSIQMDMESNGQTVLHAEDQFPTVHVADISLEPTTKHLKPDEPATTPRMDNSVNVQESAAILITSFIKGVKKESIQISRADVLDASIESDDGSVRKKDTFDPFPDTRNYWSHFEPVVKMRSGVPYHRLSLEMKLSALEFLIDELLETPVFAEILNQRNFRENAHGTLYGMLPTRKELENLENDDECAICKLEGDLICCDGCESSYHRACLDLPSEDSLEGSWHCPECLLKDPCNFGSLRGGKKSALDWFTLDDVSRAHNVRSMGLSSAPANNKADEACSKQSVAENEDPYDFEFLVVHGFLFKRRRNKYDDNAIIPVDSVNLQRVLRSIGSINCSRWPLAQIPFDSTLFGISETNSLSPSYFQNDDGRFNPNFYANKYRKAPLPLWIRHFDEAMLCEYEIRCGTATTSMLSSVLSSEMTNDKIIASSLRSSTVLFDPYKMISAFLVKIEGELLKASLLDEFWRSRETVGELKSWSYEVRNSLSVPRICRLLLELVDLTHPRAFAESWFQVPALKGKQLEPTKSKGVSLPSETEFKPNLECNRWKWERCLPENFAVLIAKEGKSLEDFLREVRPDLVGTSSRRNKRKKVYSQSMSLQNMPEQRQSDDMTLMDEEKQDAASSEHVTNQDLALSARKRSSRRSDRYDYILDDGHEKTTRSDRVGLEDLIFAEKRKRVADVENTSMGLPEAVWPLAGRRLFDPLGSISNSDCRRLGRNAGCVAAPFLAYVPTHEVGQASYHHIWRKRVAQCLSFEELLLCLRILELFLDQNTLKKCATLTQRCKGTKSNNSMEIVLTRKDIQTGLEHNLVGRFGHKFAHWHSGMTVDLAPLIHERCKRRRDWVKAKSEKIRQQEVMRIREEIRLREEKRRAEEQRRKDEAKKKEDARRDEARKKEEAKKEELRLKREAMRMVELEIKEKERQRREATAKSMREKEEMNRAQHVEGPSAMSYQLNSELKNSAIENQQNEVVVANLSGITNSTNVNTGLPSSTSFSDQKKSKKRSRKSVDRTATPTGLASKKQRANETSTDSMTECTQVVAQHISMIQALIKRFGVTAIPMDEIESLRNRNEASLVNIFQREGLASSSSHVSEVLAKAESDAMRLEAYRENGGSSSNSLFSSMETLNAMLMSMPSVLPSPINNSLPSSVSNPTGVNNTSDILQSVPQATDEARSYVDSSNIRKGQGNPVKRQHVGASKAKPRAPKKNSSNVRQNNGNFVSEITNADNRLFAQATAAALDQIRNMDKAGKQTPVSTSNLNLLQQIESKALNIGNSSKDQALKPLMLDVAEKHDDGNQLDIPNSAFAPSYGNRDNAQHNSPKRQMNFTDQVRNLHKREIRRMIEQWGTNISQEELTRIRKASESELKAAIQLDGGIAISSESLTNMLTEFETEVINEFTIAAAGSDGGRSNLSMINANDVDQSATFTMPVSTLLQEKRTDPPDSQIQYQSNGLAFNEIHGHDSTVHRFQNTSSTFQQNSQGRADISTFNNQGSFLSASQAWLPTDALSGLMQNQIGSLLSPYADNSFNQQRSWQDPAASLTTPQYFAGNIQAGSSWGYDPRSPAAMDFQLSGYNFPSTQNGFSTQQPATGSGYVSYIPQAFDANVGGGLHDILDIFQRDPYESGALNQHQLNHYGSGSYPQGRQSDPRNL